ITADGDLRVTFVFVQATMDREFRDQKMNSFAQGVQRFFHTDVFGPRNEGINRAAEIKDAIYARSHWMRSGRPDVHMHYLSSGQWVGDSVLEGSVAWAERLLEETNLFKSVDFVPMDFRSLVDLRRGMQRQNSGDIHAYRLRELEVMQGIEKSYLGAVLVDDLINIVRHPITDKLNRDVFLENIRGFQGLNNAVNFGINETLNRDDVALFPLLNNGITIVCRDFELVGPKLKIYDFQIVNGCQTSHVVFQNRRRLREQHILLPAKIVVTRDERIIERIIRASNSQTMVTEDHILSLLPFNRRLAEYFRAIVLNGVAERLYYDLREGEFSQNPRLDEIRIVYIRDQMRNFASMFMALPHVAVDRLKLLREEVPERIFNPDHALDPDYTSSLAMYRFKELLREDGADSTLENYRFQILHILRSKLLPRDFNLVNWKAVPLLCNEANSKLMDPQTSRQLFADAIEVIMAAAQQLGLTELKREPAHSKGFTDAIDKVLALQTAA
ncbi:MAG: AIPR family protein, partial [Methyloligellaceae bacterium]